MKAITLMSKIIVVAFVVLGTLTVLGMSNVRPGYVGVRYNNALGLLEEDLQPGWHLEIVGLQRVWRLPSRYLFLKYTGNDKLTIRTKDNNTVLIDVSVPYRIIPGKAHAVMDAGNHLQEPDGRYRFEGFAKDTTVSVLREHLAELRSQDFYDTDRRLEVSKTATEILNKQLLPLHLEANQILIRASYFRNDYEKQLARIQLNEQEKLLDGAKETVAQKQQTLDNYTQQTNAMVAAKAQDWERRIAEIDRAYQVGLISTADNAAPGEARRQLTTRTKPQREELEKKAATIFAREIADITDEHLLGIKNIEAETTEYRQRVFAEADGVSARLTAEGEALVAKVNGAYEAKLNALLASPGGRAYVAYQAAEHVKFNQQLKFQSSDGIPSVLRLRDFAQKFMGSTR